MENKTNLGSAIAKGALGFAATCLLAGAAIAETVIVDSPARTHITMQKQVRFGDLDLSTDQGRASLERRVSFAASDVCDGRNVQNTRSSIAYLECYSIAVRDAKQQLNQRLAAAQGSTVAAIR